MRELKLDSWSARSTAVVIATLAPVIALGIAGCSDGSGSEDGQSATTSMSASASNAAASGTTVSEKDLLLITADAATAKLNSGSKKLNIEVMQSFNDASLSTATDKGSWLVTAVCFVKGKPNSIQLISRSPSELTQSISESVRRGSSPDHFPIGQCDENKTEISIG